MFFRSFSQVFVFYALSVLFKRQIDVTLIAVVAVFHKNNSFSSCFGVFCCTFQFDEECKLSFFLAQSF